MCIPMYLSMYTHIHVYIKYTHVSILQGVSEKTLTRSHGKKNSHVAKFFCPMYSQVYKKMQMYMHMTSCPPECWPQPLPSLSLAQPLPQLAVWTIGCVSSLVADLRCTIETTQIKIFQSLPILIGISVWNPLVFLCLANMGSVLHSLLPESSNQWVCQHLCSQSCCVPFCMMILHRLCCTWCG